MCSSTSASRCRAARGAVEHAELLGHGHPRHQAPRALRGAKRRSAGRTGNGAVRGARRYRAEQPNGSHGKRHGGKRKRCRERVYLSESGCSVLCNPEYYASRSLQVDDQLLAISMNSYVAAATCSPHALT